MCNVGDVLWIVSWAKSPSKSVLGSVFRFASLQVPNPSDQEKTGCLGYMGIILSSCVVIILESKRFFPWLN